MRILGIDIGSTQIKAIELDSAFGRSTIHSYYEIPLLPVEKAALAATENGPDEDLADPVDLSMTQALEQLKSQLSKPADRVVIALPIHSSTFRNLQLPTRDKKAVSSAVGFELEDELPFPSEDTAFDYSLISQSKQGSQVHVSATLKRHLVLALRAWEGASLEPDILTTEPWAYRSLMNRVLTPSQQASPVLLIQMGFQKTAFYLHRQGLPEYIGETNWGGRDLANVLSLKLDIPLTEAENLKRTTSLVQEPLSEPAKIILAAMGEFMIEIRQLELMTRKVAQDPISLIYLAGASSEIPGLPEWIEAELEITTRPLAPWTPALAATVGKPISPEILSRYSLASGLALTAATTDRISPINFRKSDFSKAGKKRNFNFKVLKKPMIAGGIVAASLLSSLIIQSSVYKSRLAGTNTQMEKSIKTFYGQISGSAIRTYLSNPSTLRNSIKGELNKQRELNRLLSPNPRSPLDYLAQLSASIPKNTVADLVNYQAGTPGTEPFAAKSPAAASLTFLVSNPQMAEKLATHLSPRLTNMQRSKMEEISLPAEGAGKKWKITFNGTPPEPEFN